MDGNDLRSFRLMYNIQSILSLHIWMFPLGDLGTDIHEERGFINKLFGLVYKVKHPLWVLVISNFHEKFLKS